MKKNNNSFISAIATGASLNDLSKTEPQGKEKAVTEPGELNNDVQEEEKEEIQNINDQAKDEVNHVANIKPDQTRKSKSKNNKEFIENIIALYNEKNPIKNKEKTSLIVTPQLQYKLKMLALSSKVNLNDLTNAIFTSFLEENKEDIEALMKKMI
ncbi:hypothetical protein [Flavobacterium sp. GSB-24]|uniref:hypothetical protein n=1 Tax=Flavobacterium sp. GSB-24 TaxID=2994319 RepID=UPI002492277A|nr:hypothetical protein [Flavobacterium sp. GSB-24]BDU27679.1 hypothetical protein FLGSB24_44230 [Flavobacterium sp. GSB-24]